MRGEHMPPWHQPSRRDALRIGAFGSLAGAMGLASGCGSDAGASAVRTLRIAQQSELTGLDPHLESGLDEIGRASCRERGGVKVGGGRITNRSRRVANCG